MLRPRRIWTRGVAAQHASLSRWRSPVRIRSGPPSLRISLRPVRPPGRGVPSARGGRLPTAIRGPSGTIRPVTDGPTLVVLGLLALAIAVPVTGGELGFGPRARRRRPVAVVDRRRDRAPPDPRRQSRAAGPGLGAEPDAGRDADPTPGARARPSPTSRSCRSPSSGRRVTATSIKEVKAVLAGHERPLRRARTGRGRGRRDPRGARRRSPGRRGPPRRGQGRRDAPEGPRQASQAARVPARRRGRARGPGPRRGAGKSLFGDDRVTDLADWTLPAKLPTPPAGDGVRPGGDVDPGRGRRHHARPRRLRDSVKKGKGANFPFDGGTAEITSRVCCSSFGWKVPRTAPDRRQGRRPRPHQGRRHRAGQLREPGPEQVHLAYAAARSSPPTRPSSTASSRRASTSWARPTTTSATRARPGCSRRSRTSASAACKTAGSGKDLAAARKPAIIDVDGVKVAILAYDAIAASYHATDIEGRQRADEARRSSRPTSRRPARPAPTSSSSSRTGASSTARRRRRGQRKLAHQIIDAGADMIIGNHAHWTAAMEVYKGKPIWYALGQSRLRPDLVGRDDGGDDPRADVPRRRSSPRSGCDPTSSSTRPSPTSSTRPDGKVVMDRVFKNSANLGW